MEKNIFKKDSVYPEHITVCVCTYKRPELLANLINGLKKQRTDNQFTYSIVIVDNDLEKSAKKVVRDLSIKKNNTPKIHPVILYVCEPKKGLTYARNKSLDYSSGEYIAFIDDDELPSTDWLFQLYNAMIEYKADAVFGTVLPKFEVLPPKWVIKQKYFYWRDVRHGTGQKLVGSVATNNALIKRELVMKYGLKFDHDFAYKGGEDHAFFLQLKEYKKDVKYIDCKKAIVYEYFTYDRCKPEYIKRRNILEGGGRVFWIKKSHKRKLIRSYNLTLCFIHSFIRASVISSSLLFLFVINRDVGVKYSYKMYYHIGVILSILNISPYLNRKSIGLQ